MNQRGFNPQLLLYQQKTGQLGRPSCISQPFRDASYVRGSPSGRRLQRYPLASATWRVKRRCDENDRLCGEWLVYMMIFLYIYICTHVNMYIYIYIYIYMGRWLYYLILQWFVTYTPFCHFWKNCYVLNSLAPEEIAGCYVSKSKMPQLVTTNNQRTRGQTTVDGSEIRQKQLSLVA